MKVCFINPPIQDFYYTSIRRQPLGILYLMSFLEKKGHQVSLINGHSLKKHVLRMPNEFCYLRKYLEAQDPMLSFPFKHYCHFGLSFSEIRRRIAASGADIFFISSSFTPYFEETDEILAAIRELKPKALIVLGGCHASLYPEYYLQKQNADFVVRGEGEEASAALLSALETGDDLARVPNLAFRNGGAITINELYRANNIDRFPFPLRRFLTERDFKAYRKKAVAMITSRGCPNRCKFCSARIMWGEGYRPRSIESILEEVRECAEAWGATMINFEDDNIFADRTRAEAILKGLISTNEKLGARLEFTAMNGISLEGVDKDIVQLMGRAGFSELNISLMTHSRELQKEHARPFDSKLFSRIAAAGRAQGMNVRAYFILGLPGQTAEEVGDTINFLRKLEVKNFPSVYYNVFAPQNEWKMQRSSAFYNETEDLSRDDLVRLFNECRAPR